MEYFIKKFEPDYEHIGKAEVMIKDFNNPERSKKIETLDVFVERGTLEQYVGTGRPSINTKKAEIKRLINPGESLGNKLI